VKISIIIPVLNEAMSLEKCLSAMYDQDFQPEFFEVCLMDNGSSDKTLDIARSFNIRIYSSPEATIPGLRNWGAKVAKGDVLGFVDADMLVPRNWLRSINYYFEQQGLDVFGFVDLVPNTASWIGRIWNFAYRVDKQKTCEVDFLPTRNMYLLKSIFFEMGAFDEKLDTGDDKDFGLRLNKKGYKAIAIPGLNIIHLGYEKDFGEFLRKEFWRQRFLLQIAKKWDYSLRTLIMPLTSLWHLVLLPLFIYLFIGHLRQASVNYAAMFIILLLLIAPAVLISLFKTVPSNNFRHFFSLAGLYFIRYIVTGISLVRHIYYQ
jgi:glycosyltransferase involved in cell wall biosynthesis